MRLFISYVNDIFIILLLQSINQNIILIILSLFPLIFFLLIYFHIDEISRDAIVASALRDELKRIGGKLIYGNRMTTAMLRYFNVFDAVILPSLGHYMSAFPNPRQLPDNIVILPSEAVLVLQNHYFCRTRTTSNGIK